MAYLSPLATDTLLSKDHAKMHNVVDMEATTPNGSLLFDASGHATFAHNVIVTGNVVIGATSGTAKFETVVGATGVSTLMGKFLGNNGFIGLYDDDRAGFKRTLLKIENTVMPGDGLVVFSSSIIGDTYSTFGFNGMGKLLWGAGGSSNYDVNLSRTSANTLTASGNLYLGTLGASTATTTPIKLSLGDTYGTTVANSAKFKVFENNAGAFHGFGASAGQFNYFGNTSTIDHVFYNYNAGTPIELMRVKGVGGVTITDDSATYSQISASFNMALGIAVNTNLISGLDFKNFNTGGQVRLLARNDQDDYIVMNAFGSTATGTLFEQNRTDLLAIFSNAGADADKKLAIGTFTAGDVIIGTDDTTRMTFGAAGVVTLATTLALGTNNLTLTGSIGATGARATKLWATNVEITNLPTINGGTLATALSLGTMAGETATNYVAKSLFDANSILIATADDTPLALTVGASTIVGRKATGDIVALTATELRTIINVADGATANTKASSAEVDTGTDDAKFITPDAFAGSSKGKRLVQLKIVDDATALTTGDGKIIFMIPVELNGMNLVDVEAYVSTVSSSGAPTIQVRNVTQTADMLSTLITIDASEFTSLTAATPPVIDTANDDVATGDLIAIDVDGAGTGAKGLGIQLSFQTP